MAGELQDKLREVLTAALDNASRAPEAASNATSNAVSKGGPLSGMRGLALGAGAAALAPLAVKGIGRLGGLNAVGEAVKSPGKALEGAASNVGGKVAGGIGDKLSDKIDDAGGASGIFKKTLKSALPFGGGDDDDEDGGGHAGVPGVGKGRRMPVQQSVDIGVPIETVYNQWTQFEEWPNFMHRVTRVTRKDDCTVSFETKIWGKKKEFVAQIETQRPDQRIKWRVEKGMTHTGVVTFHELGPSLTRVLLGMDVEPGGMLEKAARGMRHVKRAARADLHRFKAFIEMSERETGAWRGVIEHGEVVEAHDSGYDKGRDYASLEEITGGGDQDDAGEKGGDDSDRGKRGSQRSSRARQTSGRGSGGSGKRASGRTRGSANGNERKVSSRSQSSQSRRGSAGHSSRGDGESRQSRSSRGRGGGRS